MKEFNEWLIEKDSAEITIDENILNAAVNAIANIGSNFKGNQNNGFHNGTANQPNGQANNQANDNEFKNKLRTDSNLRNSYNKMISTLRQRGINNADAVAQKYFSIQNNGKNNDGRYVVA